MSQPFVGEIRMFGGNFAPAGWMFCDGQLLPISENETLFNLIGTTYGGDGQETFGLPDLQGRVPVHIGHGPAAPDLSARREGRRRERHADHPADPDPQPSAARVDHNRPTRPSAGTTPSSPMRRPASRRRPDLSIRRRRRPDRAEQRLGHAGRRQPAARQHPAVSCASATSSRCSASFRARTDARRPRAAYGASMSDPFVAEIRMFAVQLRPTGWA